jgi:hypothetical protein
MRVRPASVVRATRSPSGPGAAEMRVWPASVVRATRDLAQWLTRELPNGHGLVVVGRGEAGQSQLTAAKRTGMPRRAATSRSLLIGQKGLIDVRLVRGLVEA